MLPLQLLVNLIGCSCDMPSTTNVVAKEGSVLPEVTSPNQPPQCEIQVPGEQDVIVVGTTTPLQAYLTDRDTPTYKLSGIWAIDPAGFLEPATIVNSGYAIGSYTWTATGDQKITLTVQDDQAASSTCEVSVKIAEKVAEGPEIIINSPSPTDWYAERDPVAIQATITDADSAPSDILVSLTDADDIEVATGNPAETDGSVTFDLGVLPTGNYSYTFTATDEFGLSISQTLTFDVYADTDGDGYPVELGDCDDNVATQNPYALEICDDEIDDNCDGIVSCNSAIDFSLADADIKLGGDSARGVGDINNDGFDDIAVRHFDYDVPGYAFDLLYGPISDSATADAILSGDDGNEIVGAGDTNADGFDDLLVSDSYFAYLIHSPVSGTQDVSSVASAQFETEPQLTTSRAHINIAGAGDVDGNGYADLLIGDPDNGDLGVFGAAAGAAYLVLSPVIGVINLANATAKFVGEAPGDKAGHSIATAGDTDGDGLGDVLVGTNLNAADSLFPRSAYLLRGPLGGTINLSDADVKLQADADSIDHSVAKAGDTDGDGLDDFMVGAAEHGDGVVYLFTDSVCGAELELASATAKFDSPDGIAMGRQFYNVGSQAGVGDVDGDGFDDLLLRGGAYAFLAVGPFQGTVDPLTVEYKFIQEPYDFDELSRVDAAGDVDADGIPDILMSDNYYDTISYLILGASL